MKTENKIELLKNYFYCLELLNDNFITYDYDNDLKIHYFMFNDIIYTTQITFIISLNIIFHIQAINNNIYLAIRD